LRTLEASYMKATGLRFVVGFAAGALLVAGSLLSSPTAYADEAALKAAFDDYAAGRYEDALKKLQDYVASNPGDEEVYRVVHAVEDRVLLRALARGGDHERLMKYLLDKARPVVEGKKRDPEAIKALVDQAINGEFDAQRRADMELASRHGDYAVPHILPALSDSDSKKVTAAIFALHYIGAEAVHPLVAALDSPDARLRGYAAVVLGDLKDTRALPALRRAVERDADEGVKAKAQAAILKIRGDAGAPSSAAESYVRLGQRYYENNPAVISEPDQMSNLWRWEGDALARYEVSAGLHNYALAEQHATTALSIQPDFMPARSLLVRTLLAMIVQGRNLGEQAPESLKGAWDVAVAQGFDAACAALSDALDQRDWSVAVESARLVGATYGGQPLQGTSIGRALVAPERRVAYAAAIASLRMSPQAPYENSASVPALAAQAAAETALRQVFVIDDHDDARSRLGADLHEAGYVVAGDRNGYSGLARLKATPTVDVVIVRADLGSAGEIPSNRWRGTLAVLDELAADTRTKGMRVVVVVGGSPEQVAAQKEFLSKKYGEGVTYIEEPLVTTAYLPIVEAAAVKGELNRDRAAALVLAADAGDAFAATNALCSAWDFRVAVDALSKNAVEGGADDVKMNAVRALGNLRAGGAAALAKVLSDAEAKEELRVAAAKSLGAVLSRMPGTAEEVDALVAAAKGGGAVGSAALQALGMAMGVAPEQAAKVYGDHRIDVGKKGE
jgi:HEAT repeat protein